MGAFYCCFCIVLFYFQKEEARYGIISVLLSFFLFNASRKYDITANHILKSFPCHIVGKTIAGTTDSPTELSPNPAPKEAEIQFILSEIKHYLTEDLEGKSPKPVSSFSKICLTGSLPPV